MLQSTSGVSCPCSRGTQPLASARRARRQKTRSSINPWLGYTDMLSGILLVVIFAMGLITLTQERKPPIIDLTEDCLPEKDREEQRNCRQFGFLTGSYILSEPFLKALDREYNDKIKPIIQDYRTANLLQTGLRNWLRRSSALSQTTETWWRIWLRS